MKSAADNDMHAAEARAKQKHDKYDAMAAEQKGLFFALVMESLGGMTRDIDAFIMTCIGYMRQTRRMQPQEEQHIIEHALATMSFALWRGNAELAETPIHTGPRDDAPAHQHRYTRTHNAYRQRRR